MEHLFFLDFHFTQLLQPQWYIEHGGLWFVLFVVFAETGLFAGFFLPGDSLLFVTGMFAHEMKNPEGATVPGLGYQVLKLFGAGNDHSYWIDLMVLTALIAAAGILGNMLGYYIGRRFGPGMHHWKDRWFFKQRYLTEAHEFYEKYGGSAIVMARFVPIVRTFAPLVAGIVEMNRAKFSYYNIIGSIAWVTSMIFGGFFLQKWLLSAFNFDLKQHLEIIVLGIVFITTLPLIIKFISARRKRKNTNTQS